MTVLYNFLLVSLVMLSAAIVLTHKLRIAIVLSGLCSMLAAFVYLFLAAPDVALAEAVIGSTLSTIIFLVGIRKYRVCTVCALPSDTKMENRLLSIIDRLTAKKELEAALTHARSESEMQSLFYDIGYLLTEKRITIYGEQGSYLVADVHSELMYTFPEIPISVVKPSTVRERQ